MGTADTDDAGSSNVYGIVQTHLVQADPGGQDKTLQTNGKLVYFRRDEPGGVADEKPFGRWIGIIGLIRDSMEDKQKYFFVPIQLLRGLADDPRETLLKCAYYGVLFINWDKEGDKQRRRTFVKQFVYAYYNEPDSLTMELAEKMEEAIDEGMFHADADHKDSGRGRVGSWMLTVRFTNSNGYSRTTKNLRTWL